MGAIPLCVGPEMTQSIVCVLDIHLGVEKGHAVTVPSLLGWYDLLFLSPLHPTEGASFNLSV